eukprot:TRINITY_DN5440_c0_g2_i1.p1 TRINITY_DN5440_c0_g2~~TRINITY_DN5440_c0_g2_i1.p1  ORF type:complete len:295 (-),score=56.93 TRINITY_DN5440_c0_g2_i1:586-1470(-)
MAARSHGLLPLEKAFLQKAQSSPFSATGRLTLRFPVTSSRAVKIQAKAVASQPGTARKNSSTDRVAELKSRLREALEGTGRGVRVSAEQRGVIEELQVNLEAAAQGSAELLGDGLDRLDGLWQLEYTTAPDVLALLRAPHQLPVPLLEVGDIFQRFRCMGRTDGGEVQNVVRWSLNGILQESEGATLTVGARFGVVGPTTISLRFEEAAVEDVRISSSLEALIAPALLPRGAIQLALLQWLRALEVRFSLRPADPSASFRRGAMYQLTYLDDDALLGRASQPAGTFIFRRAQEK